MMKSDRRFDTSSNQAIDLSLDQSGVHSKHSIILVHRSKDRDSPNHYSISTPSRSPGHAHRLIEVSKRHSTSSTSRRQTERFDTRPRDRESIRLRASLLQQLDILLPQIVRTASVFASVCRRLQEFIPIARASAVFLCSSFDLVCSGALGMSVVNVRSVDGDGGMVEGRRTRSRAGSRWGERVRGQDVR